MKKLCEKCCRERIKLNRITFQEILLISCELELEGKLNRGLDRRKKFLLLRRNRKFLILSLFKPSYRIISPGREKGEKKYKKKF